MNLTKIIVMNELVPTEFYLSRNHPNPFREKTIIKYCVADRTNVKIAVFNSEGELIETLVDEDKNAGTYKVDFYAGQLPYGIYYTRMTAGQFSDTKQMEKLK